MSEIEGIINCVRNLTLRTTIMANVAVMEASNWFQKKVYIMLYAKIAPQTTIIIMAGVIVVQKHRMNNPGI